METEDTSNDQRGLERRQFCRSLAPVFLLASLSLIFAHPPYHGGLTASFILGFLVLSIICGILGRRWILVAVAVAPIVGIVGLSILLAIAFRHGGENEPPPVSNLRTINTAEVTYLSSSGVRYGTIEDLIAAKLLDDTFTGTKAAYNYTVTLDATSSGYTAEAVPASTEAGRYGYYSAPDAIVRYSTNTSLAPPTQAGKSVQ